jgi:peptide/nickel transport system permease protein
MLWSAARVTLGMVVAVVILVAPLGLAVGCIAGYSAASRTAS